MILVSEYLAFIEHLNEELRSVDNYTHDDVFNVFEKYVTNKAKLRKVIDFGLFHYDYTKFKALFEGTLFEDGLSSILQLYNSALRQNYSESIRLFKDCYPTIARGFASRTQIMWINGINALLDRLDLFVKSAFQLIGDGIENSLKPFLEFLDSVYCVSQNRLIVKKKLGVIVDSLTSSSWLFKDLYKTLFFDITVSQWRNIADHESYSCATDGKIKIYYGEENSITKYIGRQEL